MKSTKGMFLREWCKESTRDELIDQWDTESNDKIGMHLDDTKPFSRKEAYWRCPDYPDHLYPMSVCQRTAQNQGCPFCSGKRVLVGFNDLATKCPYSVEVWDYGNNWDKKRKRETLPSDHSFGSTFVAHFVCPECHESYPMMVKKFYEGNRCKYCAHIEVKPDGSNSFAAEHPDQLQYWDYEKNDKIVTEMHPNGVRPEKILSNSNIRVHWRCGFGHTWNHSASVQCRYPNCTRCNRRKKFSNSEKAVAYYIERMFPGEVEDNYNPEWNRRQDLDVFISSESIAIQYDGYPFHDESKIDKDLRLGREVISHGIRLIRIREEKCPSISDGSLEIRRYGTGSHVESLNACIESLLQTLSNMTDRTFDFSVDCDRDKSEIIDRSHKIELSNSISVHRPDLIPIIAENDEHPQKRDVLSKLPMSHNGKIWWTCPKCGLDHDIIVYSVTNKPIEQFPCRIIAGKVVVVGVNDFESQYPELMKDWDWENNNAHGIDPKKITKGSKKGPFYWKCHVSECGCQWTTKTLSERTRKDATGCPDCYAKKRNDRTKNKGAKYTVKYLMIIRDNPGITAREIHELFDVSSGAAKSKLGDMAKRGEISYEKMHNPKGPEYRVYSITDKGLSILNGLDKDELLELTKYDLSKIKPRKGIDNQPTWCKNHNRKYLLDEWSLENADRPEDHIASDDDVRTWVCHVCSYVWSCSISYRTIGGHDCRECSQRSKREIEYVCLQYIRDNPNTSGQTLATTFNKNLTFILDKLKALVEENKMIRTKKGRAYYYSITDNGIREIEVFSKLLDERGPRTSLMRP